MRNLAYSGICFQSLYQPRREGLQVFTLEEESGEIRLDLYNACQQKALNRATHSARSSP